MSHHPKYHNYPVFLRNHGRILKKVLDKSSKEYPTYGGMGITIAKRWLDPVKVLKDFHVEPSDNMPYIIQRVDETKGWSYNNCWMSKGTFVKCRNPTALRKAIIDRTVLREQFLSEQGLPATRTDNALKSKSTAKHISDMINQLNALKMSVGDLPATIEITNGDSAVTIIMVIDK